MFDTMTWVKVLSGLCGTFLVFLLGGWASELIYHGGGGHGDGHDMAYVIHAAEDDGPAEPIVEGPPFAELYAAADVDAGANLFRRNCASCHSSEAGGGGNGPYLHGVVGRATGSVDGYNYSGALVAVVAEWSPEELSHFLEAPSDYAPGTAMVFRGFDDAADRANLIAWLDALDG